MTLDASKLRKAIELINAARFKEAVRIAKDIKDEGSKAAILIDAGYGMSSIKTVREGILLLQNLLNDPRQMGSGTDLAGKCYNIANGYYAVVQLRNAQGRMVIPGIDPDLRMAKRNYREALEIQTSVRGQFVSQLYINYANCLCKFGRGLEALKFYEVAIEKDPSNPMAPGNLGQELVYLGSVLSSHNKLYFDQGRHYLKQALSMKSISHAVSTEAATSFGESLEWAENVLSTIPESEIRAPSLASMVFRFRNRKYLGFCAEKGLFLNAWIGDHRVDNSVVDSIKFGPITRPISDQKTVPEMLKILNDAKETFSTARYLFFLALDKPSSFTNISKITTYFKSKDQELNALNIGLCKAAFLRAFDVLDKVARIANVYFRMGNRRASFWNIFAQKHSAGESRVISFVTRPEVAKENNMGLFALADLCIDYFEREHTEFKEIDDRRNWLTHDYMVVTEKHREDAEQQSIGEKELYEQTERVLQLAKYSILYMIMAVSISEGEKESGDAVSREYEHYHGS